MKKMTSGSIKPSMETKHETDFFEVGWGGEGPLPLFPPHIS